MGLKYGFFNSVNGDRRYNADDMAYPYKGIVSDGVVAHPDKSDGFQVVAGSGLQVKVSPGFGMFAGKWCENAAAVNLTVEAAHVTMPRIDTVYIKVDLSEEGRRIDLLLNTGTPSSSPQAMAFTQTGGERFFRLADIRVEAGATEITQSDITDQRPSAECGFVTNLLQNSDISATYAQWEAQFREWMAASESEYGRFMEESQERIDTAVSGAGATVDGYEERVNEAIDNANGTAERLDTDVRRELAEAVGTAEQTIATLDTEARDEFNTFLTDSEGRVDRQIEESQQEFDAWFANVQQTLGKNTLMTGYFQKFVATEDDTGDVPINITAYTSVRDVLLVHVNGMLLVPDEDYTVTNFEKVVLAKPIDKDTVVTLTVFKTIDGSDAETVVQQVADLSREVDELKGGSGGGGVAANSENFTFVVDSDLKLAEWANNDTSNGQDYTSVLIRRGTWSCILPQVQLEGTPPMNIYGINIGRTSTKRILGEAGSILKLRTTASVPPIPEGGSAEASIANGAYMIYGIHPELTADHFSGQPAIDKGVEIENVHIDIESDAHYIAAFGFLGNLRNCKAKVKGKGGYNISTSVYQGCILVDRCSGEAQGDYYVSLMSDCRGVGRCWASGPITSTNGGAAVYSKSYASMGGGDDWFCADTAAGGFNDITNPSA